jgi:hypothetical protein
MSKYIMWRSLCDEAYNARDQDTVAIPLGHEHILLIDSFDFALVRSGPTIHVNPCRGLPYARLSDGRYLHRILLDAPSSMLIDHINHNTLDNRRSNLRLASAADNQHNRTRQGEYIGVRYRKDFNKWTASITVNYKHVHLGCFDTAVAAALARDRAALKYRNDFAVLNFPLEGLP